MRLIRLVFVFLSLTLYADAFAVSGKFINATGIADVQYVQHGFDHATLSEQLNFSGGAAAGDFDGDGWVDLFVTRLDDTDILYRNLGGELPDGESVRFEDVSVSAGLTLNAPTNGAAWGDIDNDGDLDLYVTTMFHPSFYLYINNGDGTFTEDALARGATIPSALDHIGTSVSFGDYNRDGWLDIHVNEWGIDTGDPAAINHSVLLRNRGDEMPGHFENVTASAGVAIIGATEQFGFTTAFTDLDGDDWPDLLVVGDHRTVNLFWNNGDGTFFNGTETAKVNQAIASMGLSIGDYNADGLLDIYITSILDNRLYENQGDRTFIDRAQEFGVRNGEWGWGTSFFDMENDRDLDIIMTNGFYQSENPPEGNLVFTVDRMRLWENIDGEFNESAVAYGLEDIRMGKGLLTFDYDRDGDLDVFIVNNGDKAILYRNDLIHSNNWIQFQLQGTRSNRQGIGAKVWLTANQGESAFLSELSGDNHFQGQSEKIVHFGLGANQSTIHQVRIEWPSGIIQILEDLDADQRLLVVEPEDGLVDPPQILSTSENQSLQKDDTLVLKVNTSLPTPAINWYKDGVRLEGVSGSEFEIEQIKFFDAGSYTVKAINASGEVESDPMIVTVDWDISHMSVARAWNETLLDAIRKDFPAPTIHGRNLYHVSAAMWDAFWAYESGGWDQSLPAFHKETPVLGISRAEDQREAISYAAYRVLYQRYKDSIGADYTLFAIDWLMNDLGFDPAIDTTVGDSPAAVGNRIAAAIIAEALNDGSNEANDYADTSGYTASNAPLKLNESGTDLAEPNLWQPLAFDFRITQNGIEVGESVQEFIGVNWREVDTFAIEKDSSNTIAIDPGPPPLLDTSTQQEFLDAAVEVIRYSSFLDPNKNVEINVSPGGRLNNRLGENEGSGRSLNPVTGEKYVDNWVNQADYGRILAEFWADGPASETPPGHWNTLHNEIAEDPLFKRRYGGVGEELPQLEWDIQAYLALNGAMHDAAIAAWTLKRQYDYVRPISIIRHLGELGQSTDSDHPSYHPQGLPLTDDLVEIITAESAAAGQRHAHLSDYIGEIAIYCWAGEPTDPETEVGGVDWIRAVDWLPYQRDTFVTPAFAAYVSGHSTFSRAAAEVMTLLTGSSYFPGGMGEFTFEKSEYLEFEDGPSEDVTLQWATYYDAADQAGISRLYGGIHVRADDFVGRNLGARVGLEAFLKAHHLRYGALAQTGIKDPHLSLGPQNLGDAALLEVELQSDNRSLPTSLVASPEEGIYFSATTKGLEVDVTCIEVSNLTIWPDFETGQSATEATFEISGQSPKIIYLRHLGEDAGMTDTPSLAPKIELFSLDAQKNETPIADNTAWINAERASLLEVGAQYLGLAEIQHDSQNAGLIATLAPGAYLIRLTQTGAIPSSSQFEIHLLE